MMVMMMVMVVMMVVMMVMVMVIKSITRIIVILSPFMRVVLSTQNIRSLNAPSPPTPIPSSLAVPAISSPQIRPSVRSWRARSHYPCVSS